MSFWPSCFMVLTVNSACPVLTSLSCCAQPELTFIVIDVQRAAQAPDGTGALCAGRWQCLLAVQLIAPARSAMSLVLIVLQACVVMSTCF